MPIKGSEVRSLCLKKGFEELHVPASCLAHGTRNPSNSFVRHNSQGLYKVMLSHLRTANLEEIIDDVQAQLDLNRNKTSAKGMTLMNQVALVNDHLDRLQNQGFQQINVPDFEMITKYQEKFSVWRERSQKC